MNPIVHTKFTADPAPVVFTDPRYHDRLFVYTSHDAPGADYFVMDDMLCYSTTDLVNWTDHGPVMNSSDFAWAKKNTFWAPQVIDRNGKFYAYVPIEIEGKGPQIGVGVSDSPYGPFKDALGKPLVEGDWTGDIDPTVFIDDDSQAYLAWGNPQLKWVKLKENMIELDGEIVHVPMTESSFGPRAGGPSPEGKWPTAYEEGPWLMKRDIAENPYYLIWAGGQLPEHIGYSRASSPTGPWVAGGTIMFPQEGTAFTIHPGITDYRGHSYFFYHTQRLTHLAGFTGGFTRSVSVEEFAYEPDGSIPVIPLTAEGPAAVDTLNPYEKVPAATMARCEGILTQRINESGPEMCLYDIHDGASLTVKNVDFGAGASAFTATVASDNASSDTEVSIEIRTREGQLLGTLPITGTGGWDEWQERSIAIAPAPGVHDITFTFTGHGGEHGGELVRVADWKFGA